MLLQTLLLRKQPEKQQGSDSAFGDGCQNGLLKIPPPRLSFWFILIPGRTVLNFLKFVLFDFTLECDKDTWHRTSSSRGTSAVAPNLRRHLIAATVLLYLRRLLDIEDIDTEDMK